MSIKADGTVNHMRCYLDYKNDKREQCPNVKLCDDFECKLNNNKCNPTPDCIDYIARG